MRIMRSALSAVILTALLFGCGGGGPSFQEVSPTPRRLVVWLGAEGLDAETAERMRAAGVDEVVVRRGSMNLAGRAPVLRFNSMPPVGLYYFWWVPAPSSEVSPRLAFIYPFVGVLGNLAVSAVSWLACRFYPKR